MKSERSQNGKARKYRQLMVMGQSTERELQEMEKQITRIDKTAKAKASRSSNVNRSVTFKDSPDKADRSKDARSRGSKNSSRRTSPRGSPDITPRKKS
tara:strand:+ start:235 stop:528 length:294 start_codon:yes stop_codon:yes gene_type:complete